MFFKPAITVAATEDGSPYELYSDYHKDAFGCRPGARQWFDYERMSNEERAIEHATVDAWFAEGDRIAAMRSEVARFDFSRSMEYLMRREGLSERQAFIQTCGADNVEFLGDEHGFEWGYVCYTWKLPYSDEAVLKAKWNALKAGG
jgi:hypothetical protein